MTDSSAQILLFPKRSRRTRSSVAMRVPFVTIECDDSAIHTDGALRAIVANIAAQLAIKNAARSIEQAIEHVKSLLPPTELHQMLYGDLASTALVAVTARNILEALPCSVYNDVPITLMRSAISHHLSDFDGLVSSPLALLAAIDRKSHADAGPVTTQFCDGHTSTTFHHGLVLHRPEEDGPALITRDANDVVVEQMYWLDGALHRQDGPAKIAFSPIDGSTTVEYWRHGCQHRADGPATIVFDADGVSQFEMWWRAGAGLHRQDGPAVTYGKSTDAWQRHEFWVDGIFLRAAENGVEVAS